MEGLKKGIALVLLALQMAVLEYVIFHIFGWLYLLGASGVGTFLWLIIMSSVGNRKKNDSW